MKVWKNREKETLCAQLSCLNPDFLGKLLSEEFLYSILSFKVCLFFSPNKTSGGRRLDEIFGKYWHSCFRQTDTSLLNLFFPLHPVCRFL